MSSDRQMCRSAGRSRGLRDRRCARDQGGYALISVVLLIGLTALGVSALLGLVFTSIAVQDSAVAEERELRALDSAMDIAINQMRFNPASPTIRACDLDDDAPPVTVVDFDDGTQVGVNCLTTESSVTTDRGATSDQVRLVGATGYPATGGALSPPNVTGTAINGSTNIPFPTLRAETSRNWTTNQWAGFQVRITSGTGIGQVRNITSNTANTLTLSSAWGTIPNNTSVYAILPAGTTPWTEFPRPTGVGITVANLQASRPNLVHRGPEALRFGTGVTVRNSAVAQTGIERRPTAIPNTESLTDSPTLVTDRPNWLQNQWVNSEVRILMGAGAGQVRRITTNSPTQLTFTPAVNPTLQVASTTYTIAPARANAGTVTAAAATTLTDNSTGTELKSWNIDQWANYEVRIVAGTGEGQVGTITSNTDKVLTVTPAWITLPNTTSVYAISSADTVTGRATSGTTTAVNDTAAAWDANKWTGYEVQIISGAGLGQIRTITGNTATSLTVNPAWTTSPTNTSVYAIVPGFLTAATGATFSGAQMTLASATWTLDQWKGARIRILAGTGSGQSRTITGNVATQLTVNSNWSPVPNSSSLFVIDRPTGFVAVGEYVQGGPGPGTAVDLTGCGQLSANGPMRIRDLSGSGDPQCGVLESDLQLDDDPTKDVAGIVQPPPVPSVPATCPDPVVVLNPGVYNTTATNSLNRLTNGVGSPVSCDNKTFHFEPGVYVFRGDRLVFDRPGSYFVMGEPKGWSPDDGVAVVPDLVNDVSKALCDTNASGVTFVLPPQFRLEHRARTATTGNRVSMCPSFDSLSGKPLPAIYQETAYSTKLVKAEPQPTWSKCFFSPPVVCGTGPDSFLRVTPAPGNDSEPLDVWDLPGAGPRPFGLPAIGANQWRIGRTFTARVETVDPRPLSSARLLIRGTETTPANLITDRRLMVTIRQGADRICTTSAQPGMGSGEWYASIDLLTGSCVAPRECNAIEATLLTPKCLDPRTGIPFLPAASTNALDASAPNAEQTLTPELLADARIEVTQYLTLNLPTVTQRYTVEDIQLVTNGMPSALGQVSSEADQDSAPFLRGFDDAEAVRESGEPTPQIATPRMPDEDTGLWSGAGTSCTVYLLCPVVVPANTKPTDPFVHQIDLGTAQIERPQEYVDAVVEDPKLSSLGLRLRLLPDHCPGSGLDGDACSLVPNLPFAVPQSFFGTEVETRVAMATGQGTRCVSTKGILGSTTDVVVDLMDIDQIVVDPDNGCDAVAVDSFQDLMADGGTPGSVGLSVRFELPCLRDYFANAKWRCVRGTQNGENIVLQVRPPSVDLISLEATSGTIVGTPPSSRFTINARTPGSGVSTSSFNVYGRVLMPRSNLDLFWQGDVTEGIPLITDELVVGSLGSTITKPPVRSSIDGSAAERYLVCCTIAQAVSREVILEATANQRKLRARVYFSDRNDEGGRSPGFRAQIRDWQICDEGRCSGS
jgi:hypothetical protein